MVLDFTTNKNRQAIRELLKSIELRHNKIHLIHTTEPIVLKEQYIPVKVTLECSYYQYQHTAETTWKYAESEADLKQIYAFKGSGESGIERQQLDWQEVKRQASRIVVLAGLGMGKSTLLRMEACRTIQQSYKALDREQPPAEINIPLLIRFSTLAEKIAEMPVFEAILEIIRERHFNLLKNNPDAEAVDFLNDFLKEQLLKGKCVLLLDGFDEVTPEKRRRLSRQLDIFARNYSNCKIIATSRIVFYADNLSIDGAKEIEIVPFTQKETEQYIETWFSNAQKFLTDKSVTARGLIQALRDRPQIAGLAQNPLLLSLICSLYQKDKLKLPARRGQIYKQSVDYMLDEWSHDNNRQSSDDAQIDTKKELLEELAYQFSCQETEVFSLRELRHKIKDYLQRNNESDLNNNTNQFIQELSEQDGILQKLSLEEDRYLFLHRTFQEYFTASYLKYEIEEDRTKGIDLVKQYFWNYNWHETLIVLAGIMKQPMLLIEAILSTRDDIFNTQLLLAGRCIAECDVISNPLIDRTIDRIYEFWSKYPNLKFIRSVVVEIARTYDKLPQNFDTLLFNDDLDVRKYPTEGLGKIGNEQTVDDLIVALSNDDPSVRKYASEALDKIDNPSSLEKLLQSARVNTDIYDSDIFSLARSLAIRFSKQRGCPFIPVYPRGDFDKLLDLLPRLIQKLKLALGMSILLLVIHL